jgi:hypothetical protein
MDQTEIIQDITTKFSEKLDKIAKTKVKEPNQENTKEDEPVILITLLGMEELIIGNPHEESKITENDSEGFLVEYFTPKPSMFKLTYKVTPYFKTQADTLKVIGAIARLLKDEKEIPVDKFDWLENNKRPVLIEPLPGVNFEKQMQLFTMLKSEYRPSLFYQMAVGISSTKKDKFRRVQERKISTMMKK